MPHIVSNGCRWSRGAAAGGGAREGRRSSWALCASGAPSTGAERRVAGGGLRPLSFNLSRLRLVLKPWALSFFAIYFLCLIISLVLASARSSTCRAVGPLRSSGHRPHGGLPGGRGPGSASCAQRLPRTAL